ncbi:murein hydrolase activator EnvC family protein [Deinococcus koreensis]|uniref:Peptidase M23 n=1 Tax=Deinococcus koreensis TaxID=2054903 RepID=A0A2K3UUI6_9DEIO|nr:peptidoglycan DD-metalloendopeptidase family protein [Deinococcus koreensis]PNY80203.1 peptidase M23 [Deinococcus koreensis]
MTGAGGRARRLATGWLLITLLTVAAAQTTSERLQQLQRDLQEQKQLSTQQAQQLSRLRENIQNLSAQQKQTLARLETLAAGVGQVEQEVVTLTTRVSLAERVLADTTSRLNVTQTRVDRLRGDVREILNTQYRDRSGRYLQLLSQSRSLSDLLIRVKYANLAGQYNVQIIETLRLEVQNLASQQALQASQARSLKESQAQRAAALARLRERRQQQAALLAQLRRSEQGQRTLAAQQQAERALTVNTIDQLVGQVVAERARLEAERQRRLAEERRRREEEQRRLREAQERARLEALRLARLRAQQERQRQLAVQRETAARQAAQEAAQREREQQVQREQEALRARQQQVQAEQDQADVQLAPLPPLSGPLGFPLPGGRVSAPYGTNGAPWVILQGNESSQAVAALPGNVWTVSLYASLGYVVLVDHGGSVTAYMGLRDPLVSVGDRVSRGTPLGTVGGSQIFGPLNMAFQLRRGSEIVAPGF